MDLRKESTSVRTATGGYKEKPKFHRVCRGVGVAHSTVWISKQHTFERGREQCFHHVSEEVKERRLRKRYKLLTNPVSSEETIPESQTEEYCECLWKKMIGKAVFGKIERTD